ncbi:MAG: phenylalanine--tRNA ligase subunit beta, partial [Dehalococcoidales bacterium]|nr:phenylalanine--tRNA ligase subunit beta [Dehalococcoidales bacterium]
ISNYVMLEYGQPLHTFDYEKLRGKKIVVKRAKEGEKFVTLDENERELSGDMLTIADGEKTVALAGVMGGLNSDVTESTTSILLEAASFKATNIHYTSHKLGLLSEASSRFERGISAGLTIAGLKHATQLIAELGEGTVAKGIIDVYPGKKEPKPVTVRADRVKRLLGIEYIVEQIAKAFQMLGIECKKEGEKVIATSPYWRSDLKIEEDYIEEVARVYGYDKIPTTLIANEVPQPDANPSWELKKKIRRSLTGFGFQEAMTYTLASLKNLSNITAAGKEPEPTPIHITNPMTADQEYLRTSLRSNLMETLAANQRHEEGGIKLFEIGKIFLPRPNNLPEEPEMLCGLMSGSRIDRSWLGEGKQVDFYDVKGAVEGLFEKLGIPVSFEASSDEGLHPARQAGIVAQGEGKKVKLGVIGEVHPKVAAAFEVAGTVCLFEVSLKALLPYTTEVKMYKAISRFPSVVRDIALVIGLDVSNQQVLDIIQSFKQISEVILFDVYSGKQVAEGKKSLAYRLVYQSAEQTLTDEAVNKVQEQVLKKLNQELGATLR